MRPDAVSWKNTNDLAALEFAPRNLLYRRIPAWIKRTLVLQMLLSCVVWYGLRATAVLDCLPAVRIPAHLPWVAAPAGVNPSLPVKAATPTLPDVRRAPHADGRGVLEVVLAELVAYLVTLFAAVVPIRSTLRQHVAGLQTLFHSLRTLASGVAPKPLAVGEPGEISYLALAFNDMSSRLWASQRRLTEINQTLEQRVDERTSALREAAVKLDKMASTDVLSGLANRRALVETGDSWFETCKRRGSDLVCLLTDLDNFKSVNDTLGHKKGDELICLAAAILRQGCRSDDLVARLGGDEFVIVMSGAGTTQAVQIAERIQHEFAQQVGELYAGSALKKLPSISIGVASLLTANPASFEELLMRADTALYRAKDLGKGRTEIYGSREAA